MAKVDIRLDNLKRIHKELEKAKDLAVKVGVAENAVYAGKKSADGSPLKVSEVATYLEFGWSQNVTLKQSRYFHINYDMGLKKGTTLINPPRPIFRATASANESKWQKIGKNLCKDITDAPYEKIEQALRVIGQIAVQDVMETIRNGGTSQEKFAKRSGFTQELYKKQLQGHKTNGTPNNMETDRPLTKQGWLMQSIKFDLIKGNEE